MNASIVRAALVLLVLSACDKPAEATAAKGGAQAAAASPAASAAPADLFAFASGARWVAKPDDVDYGYMAYTPYNLIDETPATDWMSTMAVPAVFVLELPERTSLTRIGFDSGGMNFDEKSPRDVKVEVSDASATSGFSTVLTRDLAMGKNDQDFSLEAPAVGRWVRLTITSNHGADYVGMTGFRGYGEQLTHTAAIANVSGTYEGGNGWGAVHLKQEGTRVVGCYEFRDGVVAGGVDGPLLKVRMTEQLNGGGEEYQLGLFTFSPDGRVLYGLARTQDSSSAGYDSYYSAARVSADIGDCPRIPGWRQGSAAESQLSGQLAEEGRARLDGVNFDFNTATLQPASRPLLDQVVQVLKDNPAWKAALEGHTDNVGGEAFNRTLSAARAETVRAYLQAGGIAADRLYASGFGFSRPVASNDTQGGRAQNRRVEIVKGG